MWLTRKLFTTSLKEFHTFSSFLLICLTKSESFISIRIWGQKKQSKTNQKYQLSTFRLTALEIYCRCIWSSSNSYLRLWKFSSSQMWGTMEGRQLSSWEGSFITFVVLTGNFSPERSGSVFFFQCLSLALLPYMHNKHGYLVYPLCWPRKKLTIF